MLQWIQGFIYLFELVFLLISEKSSRIKFLHLMEVLSLIFWELSLLFSTGVAPIYIPTNSAQRFSFFHIPATLVICCLSDNSPSKRSKVVSHSGFFQFASSWASLHMSVGHLYVFFKKVSIQVLCHIFPLVSLIPWHWVISVLCIFWILVHYWTYHLQISSPIWQVAFTFYW